MRDQDKHRHDIPAAEDEEIRDDARLADDLDTLRQQLITLVEESKRRQVEQVLERYSRRLKEVAAARADQLSRTNEQLRQEIADRRRTEQVLHQRTCELELLNRSGQVFNSTLNLDQVLATILGEIGQLLQVNSASVWLIEPETGDLVCRYTADQQSKVIRGYRLPAGQGIAGWVVGAGQSLIVPDAQVDERYFGGVEKQAGLLIHSMLIIPLRRRDQIIGVLEVMDESINRFDAADLNLVEALASEATIAIENARLYEESDKLREFNQNIVHSIQEGVFILDKDQSIIFVNPMGAELLGYAPEALLGRSWQEVAAPDQIEIMRGLFVKWWQGETERHETLVVTNDNRPVPVIVSGRRLQAHNQADTLLLMLTDITERKMMEEFLVISEERHRAAAELASDYAYAFSIEPDGSLTREWLTGSFTYVTGYTGTDLERNDNWLTLLIHPDDMQIAERRWRTLMAGQACADEFRIITKKGEMRWLDDHARPVWDETENRVVRIYGAAQDITLRKQAEEALRQRTLELETRNEELDAFVHTVAHDLRNPLNIVIGFAELLERDEGYLSTDDKHLYYHLIARKGRIMINIIDELLLLAGVRKANVSIQPLEMDPIVAAALERLADMIGEYEPQIVLPPSWPAALGYAPWIEEVWMNYISNAIKYGGRPPCLELGGDLVPQSSGQPALAVRFWIRDNGAGIPLDQQERLFKPFERLDQARIAGTGLGLSIVRRIVERLGGQVGLESNPDRGSTFTFSLPPA